MSLIYSTDTIDQYPGGRNEQNILDQRNGVHMQIDGFTVAQVNDRGTGTTADADDDDGSRIYEKDWTINGTEKYLKEIEVYNNCTLYLKDGTEVKLDVVIFLFDDGTYAFSALAETQKLGHTEPNSIPSINPAQIDYSRGLTLGDQEYFEYDQIGGKGFGAVGSFKEFNEFFICFTSGTLIMTRNGNVPVEELAAGDDVLTLDHGYQKIRWIGSRKVTSAELILNEKLRPVRIRAGALGSGLPARDLIVSRQHRIFLCSKVAENVFGAKEVLIPAIKLTMIDGIDVVETCRTLVYWHILFDQHEVIFSEGCPTESLFTGPQALKALSPAAIEEIQALFPEISRPDYIPQPARHFPAKGKDIKKFIARSIKNHIAGRA